MKNKRLSVPGVLMLIFLAAVATFNITFFIANSTYNKALGNLQGNQELYSKLTEITGYVDKYFIAESDSNKLIDGAAKGLVNALGDQWSGYYTEDEYKMIKESKENTYAGVGITVSYDEAQGYYMVASVTEGSPAAAAGVGILSLILEVNGANVSATDQTALVNMVRGEPGTTVDIKFRDKDGVESVKTLERSSIYTPDITSKMVDGNVGYIRIDGFDEGAEKEFARHLQTLIDQGAGAMVFDVRMNGGGYANVMSNMLDLLLPEGMIISMTDKDGVTEENKSDAECIKLPMAVLINKYSISAAEFFAAAVQEYGVGTIVGDQTGGKGYAQNLIPLSDGSALNLSIYRFYTPKGNSLAGVGVKPDVEVSLTEDQLANFYNLTLEEDAQLQKAVELVKAKIK